MLDALRRARFGIITVGFAYFFSVLVGTAMVHSGNRFALGYRDRMVGKSVQSDAATLALLRGHRVTAAVVDFSGNLFMGAVPQTVSGLGVLPPYYFALFRGWIGGIVSVDDAHHSRLADPRERTYLLTVLVLQLIPYTLTGGAGVYLGWAWTQAWRDTGWKRQWRFPMPRRAILDALWIYALAVPLFLGASFVEFLYG
jgi:hypothetical protein